MAFALDSFAKEHVDENTLVVLLWDQAGFHRSDKLRVPEGLRLYPLPPYTPELQPAERLWPSLREAVCNRWIKSIAHLEALLIERIRTLLQQTDYIHGLTGFHWLLAIQTILVKLI